MAVEHCLAQTVKDKNTHTVERGIRMCGDRGMESAMKEMKQMHCRQTFAPVLPSDLDPEEKRKVLNSVSFMKEKNNEEKTLKTRTAADGRKPREDEIKGKTQVPLSKQNLCLSLPQSMQKKTEMQLQLTFQISLCKPPCQTMRQCT